MRYLALISLLIPSIALADSTRCVSVSPTIDTAAYASGDIMGSELRFQNILKDSTKAGYVTSITIADDADQAVDLELVILDKDPGSAGSDNAAYDPADADIDYIRSVVLFGSSNRFSYNDNAMLHAGGLSAAVGGRGQSTRDLWAHLVARGAYDGDADSITVTICVSQD